jgi:hypothetical protein
VPDPDRQNDSVRQAFAHEAVVVLEGEGDPRTLGAAITVHLCGSWDHEPPCPLAPHHTRADRDGAELTLRVLFAAAPADELLVRRLIDHALATGWGDEPGGVRTTWELVLSRRSTVREEERAHARRLARS